MPTESYLMYGQSTTSFVSALPKAKLSDAKAQVGTHTVLSRSNNIHIYGIRRLQKIALT